MTIGKGFASRLALGVESTYGTPVAITELIPFTSESVNKLTEAIESKYLDGSAARKNIVNGAISVDGDFSGELVYDEIAGDIIGIERLLKGALGDSARDAGNGLNKYYMATELDNHYTLVFNKQVSAWEGASIKFGTLTLAGAMGEDGCTFSIGNLRGHTLRRTGDAGIINNIAAVTGLSPTNIPSLIKLKDATFRVADQANALASGDQVCINSFELSVDNSISDPEYSTVCSGHTDSDYALEAGRNGLRVCKFKITIPRYDADTFFDFQSADTALQADLKFALGSYEFNILLPYLKVTAPTAPIGGPEMITHEVEFDVLRNGGRNTYLTFQDSTAIADEIGIECKSARTSAA